VLKLLLPGTGLRASLLAKSTAAGTDFSKVCEPGSLYEMPQTVLDSKASLSALIGNRWTRHIPLGSARSEWVVAVSTVHGYCARGMDLHQQLESACFQHIQVDILLANPLRLANMVSGEAQPQEAKESAGSDGESSQGEEEEKEEGEGNLGQV
jgi:hypothetical protein